MVKSNYEVGDIVVSTMDHRPVCKSLRDAMMYNYEVWRVVGISEDELDNSKLTFVDLSFIHKSEYRVSIPLMFMDKMFINFGKAENIGLLWSHQK